MGGIYWGLEGREAAEAEASPSKHGTPSDLSLIEGALIVMRETSGHKTLANVALEAVARLKGVR